MSRIYIGMGGWELYPFNKYFYPPKPKKGFRKLEYYAQFFDCIEINATFYNTSFTPTHAQRWLEDVRANENFTFTVKLYQGFTHSFNAVREDTLRIYRLLDVLADAGKLGGLLIQFPYSFSYSPEFCTYLTQLSKTFRRYRLFIEVRHNSWNTSQTQNFFQENNLHLVNVDLPPIKQHMPFTCLAWNGAAYFRMMGKNKAAWNNPWRLEPDKKHLVSDRYNYLYTEEELDHLLEWIEKVKAYATTIVVIFHNDPEANSLINGFQLRHLAERKQRVLVPRKLINKYPKLKEIGSEANAYHPLFA